MATIPDHDTQNTPHLCTCGLKFATKWAIERHRAQNACSASVYGSKSRACLRCERTFKTPLTEAGRQRFFLCPYCRRANEQGRDTWSGHAPPGENRWGSIYCYKPPGGPRYD